jgi:hypothetical protein
LLLILIAVAAAVLLYTWVSGLSSSVTSQKVTGKTLTLIQATWAMPNTATTLTPNAFTPTKAVLILSFQAPPAAVQGSSAVTLDNVDVLYNGRVICHYADFALSADDAYHTGKPVGVDNTAHALVFYGYYGQTPRNYDPEDLMIPGGISVTNVTTPTNAAGGTVAYDTTVKGVITNLNPFVTVVAGTWEVNYVSTNYVETNFTSTGAVIKYDRFANAYLQPNLNIIPLFDKVTVSQSNFALVIWCPNVNPNVMGQVTVKIYFPDGSSWSTKVPLSIQ